MSLTARMILVLTVVGLLAGGLLTGVGKLTTERIALNKQREVEEAIIRVVPGTQSSQKLFEDKDLTVYAGRGTDGALAGFAVYTFGGGFQDRITLMYGTDIDLTRIHSLTILEQQETPGLGAKITDTESFLMFWENKDISSTLTLRKPAVTSPDELGPYEINTITGATISSEAVLNTVNLSLERLRGLKDQGQLDGEENNAG